MGETAAVCMSHSPLLRRPPADGACIAAVDTAIADARAFVTSFDPALIVCVAPDHVNGFRYRAMPQICVGTAAAGIGDFGSPAGDLDVPEELALSCVQALLAADIDVAVSRAMQVDHAFSQPLELLTGALSAIPVVPVFVNAAAAPRASLRRARTYGAALGGWAATLGCRVLFVGSGGLSHDPPTPVWAGADAQLRARLLDGPTPQARAAREAGVEEAALAFAAGTSDLAPLAPDLDSEFLDILCGGRLEELDGWDDAWLGARGGRAMHEVRSWVVACSALGGYDVRSTYYRPVPEWIVSFGVLTAVGR
jgi:2,3-dihydroxyphenylpropionate 1,2-dioxygenase